MQVAKKVYLSGKITANDNYKEEFATAEAFLRQHNYITLNPARLDEISDELSYEEYLEICYKLIDIADIIFMGWEPSEEELVFAAEKLLNR